MKNLLDRLSSLQVLAAAAILTVFSAGIYLMTPHAGAASTVADGQHLITIHDGGRDKSFITTAATLSDAFKRAHITIDSADLVEPSVSTTLSGGNYDVNIYRAQPVTIVDGPVQKRVMSPYRTAKQIVEHAGLTLHDEDRTKLSGPADVMRDGPGLTLKIDRATPLTLVLYGKPVQSYTQAKTVDQLLSEKNIHLAKADGVTPSRSTAITTGMQVSVWRNGVQTITQQEAIAFTTKQIQDADQPEGYKKIQTSGKDGSKMVTYEINMQNGHEVSRKAIQSVDITQPVQQVEIVGTKVSLPPGSHTDWMAAAGMSASNYGYIDYIFVHESGWNPASVSPGRKYVGLGQTNEANLSSACPQWQSDPICQIKFFDGYKNRYGSWQAAYEFKKSHGWW